MIDKLSIENDIKDLPEEYKKIITYIYQGYKYREVAEKMELTMSQVSKRLSKIRIYLKERHYENN